jgi:CheY-like chemotaxis protein
MHKHQGIEYPSPQYAGPIMKSWRILFLDSAEHVQKLKSACKEAGYEVAGACTIKEAWAFLNGKDHVDVIVCAAHLEEESVFEFLKGVRESEVHRHAGFLILSLEPSGKARGLHHSTARAAKALGADTYAVMPVFDPHELVALIEKLEPPLPPPHSDEEKLVGE